MGIGPIVAGDIVQIEIEQVGVLINPVADDSSEPDKADVSSHRLQ
jgi:fumarylacetoacetate (FAA) hydrolase family protein